MLVLKPEPPSLKTLQDYADTVHQYEALKDPSIDMRWVADQFVPPTDLPSERATAATALMPSPEYDYLLMDELKDIEFRVLVDEISGADVRQLPRFTSSIEAIHVRVFL